MKNELMTFSSEELNFSMSAIIYEGKPAFDAVELAKSLGYTNPAKALKDHCKSLIKIDYNESLVLGFGEKPRGTQLAGQSDLFRLILRSQLPSAERVQDWVCEDVLPSIMTTGAYSKEAATDKYHKQETSMNHDILSLARVVAEATASATMKAVMEVTGHNLIAATHTAPTVTQIGHIERPISKSEFVPMHKVSWASGLSDATCRRLVTFAGIPTTRLEGVRGVCVNEAEFLAAAQVLIDESTPPAGKRKRWQHPEFRGFELRLKSDNQQGKNNAED